MHCKSVAETGRQHAARESQKRMWISASMLCYHIVGGRQIILESYWKLLRSGCIWCQTYVQHEQRTELLSLYCKMSIASFLFSFITWHSVSRALSGWSCSQQLGRTRACRMLMTRVELNIYDLVSLYDIAGRTDVRSYPNSSVFCVSTLWCKWW